jgi:hypothetical protein
MHNMCCAYGLSALDDAAVGVFGFIGRGGRPLSCAVTPYLDGGQPVVTSTLALVAKIGAVLRDERVALLAGGAEARGRAAVAIEDDGEWFDRAIRAQELRRPGSCSGFPVTAVFCGGTSAGPWCACPPTACARSPAPTG